MKADLIQSNHLAMRLAVPLLTIALAAGCSSSSDSGNDGTTGQNPDNPEVAVNPFFEDFSQPLPQFTQEDRTTEGATSEFTYGDGFATVRVESSTIERERGRFVARGRFDSLSAVMSIEPESTVSDGGRLQAYNNAYLFNDTASTPQGGDCFIGDVGVQVGIRLNSEGATSFYFNGYRETQTDCSNGENANLFDGVNSLTLDMGPELGVSYKLGMKIDRDNKLLTLSVDDQDYTYQLLTDVFKPGNSGGSFTNRIDGAAGTAVVRIDDLSVDGQAYDFSDPDLLGRFTFWDAGKTGTDISYPNGELKLESVSTGDQVRNRIAVTGHNTRYASAQVRLSAESTAGSAGDALARVGGSMYYANDTAGDSSALNQVFAVTEIRLLESGATEARYCAWQSLDDSFSESISLVNPDNESGCNTFALTPVLNQNYTLTTYMDDANSRIVFAIDGEEHFQSVEGPVSIGDDLFEMRIESRATGDGSKAVLFADNLESAAGAAP